MLALLLCCVQAAEIATAESMLKETWGPLLYDVEMQQLVMEDLRSELKLKELPLQLEGEGAKLWLFQWRHDVMPRIERLYTRVSQNAELRPSIKDQLRMIQSQLNLDPPSPAQAPFPEALQKEVRDGIAALKKKHAALLAKDRAAALRWTERQIKELYEPLLRLNAQGLAAVRGYTRLNPDDLDQTRWKVWAEREMLPRNEETRRVLAAGFFLLEGEGPSDSVRAFLTHQHSWALRHLRWQKEKGEYAWGSRTNWPVDFSKEVETSYQILLDRRARLALPE